MAHWFWHLDTPPSSCLHLNANEVHLRLYRSKEIEDISSYRIHSVNHDSFLSPKIKIISTAMGQRVKIQILHSTGDGRGLEVFQISFNSVSDKWSLMHRVGISHNATISVLVLILHSSVEGAKCFQYVLNYC